MVVMMSEDTSGKLFGVCKNAFTAAAQLSNQRANKRKSATFAIAFCFVDCILDATVKDLMHLINKVVIGTPNFIN
jgi:hypothetical protein